MLAPLEDPDAAIDAPDAPRWVGDEHGWLVSRYADVSTVLRSREIRAVDPGEDLTRIVQRSGRRYDHLQANMESMPLFQEGEERIRYRATMRRFMADRLSRWTPALIRRTATDIVSGLPVDEIVDVVPAVAERLSGTIVADAMGLDLERVRWLRLESHRVMEIWRRAPPLRECARADAMCARVDEVLADDAGPGSVLETLRTGNAGETITQLGFWMVFAAMDTTTGTVAAALDLLARDPALQERLRQTPSLIPAFVQETLRLASPFRRLNRRQALAPFELGGVQVEAGHVLIPHIERAHRDPEAFSEPAVLDLARQGPPVLSFGAGAHACLGGVFGSEQVQLILEAFLARIAVRPTAERGRLVAHRDLRHFATLPLLLSPAQATVEDARRRPGN